MVKSLQLAFETIPVVVWLGSKFSKYIHDSLLVLLCHLFALAFVPPTEIPAAFDALKPHLPPEANDVVIWFEENYIFGRIRRHLRNGEPISSSQLFPPE